MSPGRKAEIGMAIALPIVTFAAGILLVHAHFDYGFAPFYAALAAFLLCLAASFAFLYATTHRLAAAAVATHKQEFCGACREKDRELTRISTAVRDCVAAVRGFSAEVPHHVFINDDVYLRSVITASELAQRERHLPAGSTIWVITETLVEELPGARFNVVVEENLARGINYHYFLPKRATLHAQIKAVKDSHRAHPDRIKFTYVQEYCFLLYPALDMAIYTEEDAPRSAAFIQLPSQEHLPEPVYAAISDYEYIDAVRHRLERAGVP